jgi:hypothetical protein
MRVACRPSRAALTLPAAAPPNNHASFHEVPRSWPSSPPCRTPISPAITIYSRS